MKYASSRGRGNVVIPKDFQEVWEGWKAGFLAFHAFHTPSFPWPALGTVLKVTITANAVFANRKHLSEMAPFWQIALISFVYE